MVDFERFGLTNPAAQIGRSLGPPAADRARGSWGCANPNQYTNPPHSSNTDSLIRLPSPYAHTRDQLNPQSPTPTPILMAPLAPQLQKEMDLIPSDEDDDDFTLEGHKSDASSDDSEDEEPTAKRTKVDEKTEPV